jgi:hypothetical protein
MDETNSKSEIDFQWLPTSVALAIMDPNQLEPLMKLLISTVHDSLQLHTNVLIDSAATLNFASRDFFDKKQFLGKVYSWFKNRCSNRKRTEDFH